MTFLLEIQKKANKDMKLSTIKNIFFSLALVFSWSLAMSQEIPDPPNPPRLVTDFTNTLTAGQLDQLERKLVAFNDTTSTQIAVVLVSSLNGYEVADFTDRLAEKWGVGRAGKDNGVVVLVKPKTSREKGQVRISVAYGLEGAIPDAIANRIIDNEMVPHFAQNDYYTGLDQATNTIMSLATGEFTADEYEKSTGNSAWQPIIFWLIFFGVIMLIRNITRARAYSTGKNSIPFWTALWLGSALGGHSSGSSWGDFNSGSGNFGGGGGFGGFGGGGFGGGGASGSW